MRWSIRCLFFGLVLVRAANGQGYRPEDAAAHMRVAEGLAVDLVASEPLVRQPVAIDFDDLGRLWIMQYLQYPNPAGLSRTKVDRYSRTEYDKVPEPPPRGPKGADRLTILEDSNGDGRADRAKDFLTGLNLASGFAFGRGGVFVLQVPYLLFYADKNGDDIPDGDPKVLLKGFGMQDAHSVANSLAFGPDGWLYGCQGSTVTANIRGIEFQQGVWRYQPDTDRFELFCEGGGNSWGLDFDRAGQLFYSTNLGPFVMLHGEQGGYYWKSFTKHGGLHHPFAYGYFDHVPHKDFRGGHVTVGGTIYQETNLPARFRNTYIAGDLLGHAVRWHRIHPDGSSFRSENGGELLLANDTWFAPSDLTVGPDGAVYVADWHDRRTAHPDPDADWDRSNGRIYRIRSKEAPLVKPIVDPRTLPNEQLLRQIESPNAWHARRARLILAERRDPKSIAKLRELISTDASHSATLTRLWSLAASYGLDLPAALSALRSKDENVRRWAVRLASALEPFPPALAKAFLEMAKSDPSPVVRCQLAQTARRIPRASASPILLAITDRDIDSLDPHIPLFLWWGFEQRTMDIAWWSRVLEDPKRWHGRLFSEHILRRLIARFIATEGVAVCDTLYRLAPDEISRRRVIAAIDAATEDRWFDPIIRIQRDGEKRLPTFQYPRDLPFLRVLIRQGNLDAIRPARKLAANPKASPEVRAAMVPVLVGAALRLQRGRSTDSALAGEIIHEIVKLVRPNEPLAVQLASVTAIGRLPGMESTLLGRYRDVPPAVKAAIRAQLLHRPESIRALLAAVEKGVVQPSELDPRDFIATAAARDPSIEAIVRRYWGRIQPPTPEEKLAEIRRLSNDLRAEAGNPAQGHALFTRHCAACHTLFGEGAKIGPDLTTANRQDRDALLLNIVDPNVIVRKEYLSSTIATSDGRILTGLVVESTADTLVLADTKGEKTRILRHDVAKIADAPVSLMPERLLSTLKPNELRDLFAYLQADRPPK